MTLFSKDQVLVPIDFSEAAFKALTETLEFVEQPSHLHALHVLHPLEPNEPGVIWQTVNETTRKQNVEQAFYEKFKATGPDGIHFSVSLGDPSSEIIDYAKTHNIDLIVIPSHGRTGLERFFMGSVAERVVRFAHCPVLVLRR